MSDNVHTFIGGVHSSLQSDAAPKLINLEAEAPVPRKSSLPTPTSSYGCIQCPKSFNRRENLSRHMKTQNGLEFIAFDPRIDRPLTKYHLDDVPRTHICQICEKTFTRSDLLKRHEAGHARWDKKESKSEGRMRSVKRRKTSDNLAEARKNFENVKGIPTTRSESVHLSPLSKDPLFATAATTYPNSFQEPTVVDMPEHENLKNDHRNWVPEVAPVSLVEGQQLNIGSSAAPVMPGFTFSHHETNSFPQQYQEPFQDTLLNHQTPIISHGMTEYSCHVPFSHASYLQPENSPMANEWFSNDFYAAMLETGNEWGNFGNIFSQHLPISNQVQQISSNAKLESLGGSSTIIAGEPRLEYYQSKNDTLESLLAQSANIPRIPSPSNIPLEQDKWPFLWPPTLEPSPMLEAGPITLPFEHPLFQSHNPRYDISESTYHKLRDFLTSPVNEGHNKKSLFTMPSLYVVNIFIGLYFKHFSHQAPVLHYPTVDTNQLSVPLLSTMMIIGATYSHVKNGRRFAIVLIDVIGWHLLATLNLDNSLIRNPMMIFAQALLIHMGLWCGNNRAFYVAEAFRGRVVSHMRRLYESEKWNTSTKNLSLNATFEDPQVQWKRWVNEETLKRLYWVVYTTDRQFSALWNQSSTITLGELVDLECPCDEALWCAPSAYDWKVALGSDTIPQFPSFAEAIGPFLFSLTPPSYISSLRRFSSPEEQLLQHQQQFSLPNLNPYTEFLVLLEIQHQVFDFSQECLLASKFINSQNHPETYKHSPENQYPTPGHHPTPGDPHFHTVRSPSQTLKSRIYSRRQELACTSGHTGIMTAFERLRLWAREDPELAVDVAVRAAEAVMELNRGLNGVYISRQSVGGAEISGEMRGGMIDTGAYGATLLTVAHVILWVFAQVADREQKGILMKILRSHEFAGDNAFLDILGNELAANGDQDTTLEMGYVGKDQQKMNGPPRALFRSAAETLMKFGTWGVALDMALLLHLRAEG
ncbi:hypothetical protein NHQ30_009628 [Ciborinia camelliae]|nr:hypothetical protein NHQ30_009628 [Ciborinia camelliae]